MILGQLRMGAGQVTYAPLLSTVLKAGVKCYLFHRPGCGRCKLVTRQLPHLEKAGIESDHICRLTPWFSGGPSLFSFSQDIKPVLFLLGVADGTGSLGEEEEIADPDSASPPLDFLLQAFAACSKTSLALLPQQAQLIILCHSVVFLKPPYHCHGSLQNCWAGSWS